MELRLKRPIPHLTQPVKIHRARQRVAQFALVEPERHASSQLRILEPFQCEECFFDSTYLPQGPRQAILARICRQPAEDKRG